MDASCFLTSKIFSKSVDFIPPFSTRISIPLKRRSAKWLHTFPSAPSPSSITTCNLQSRLPDDDHDRWIKSDWRSFRARLVSGEQASIGDRWVHRLHEPEKGSILIATEKLDGVHIFERAIILLTSTGPLCPTGVILNRPSLMSIKEMKSRAFDVDGTFFDRPLFFGGPLEEGLFLVRSRKGGEEEDDGVGKSGVFEEVMKGLYCGTKESVGCAAEMVKRNVVGVEDFRFFDGYCGWEKDQLKEEIRAGYWNVMACSLSVVEMTSAGLGEEVTGLVVLIQRSMILPVESFRITVFPLVYAAKSVASGAVEVFRKLSKSGGNAVDTLSAEKIVGVSDVVSHLLPFLSSLDPPLIFEVGINMLSLADVPGGKPEWASASIIAILTLWDRQEFSSARENIVRAVVNNLHLLDLSMQVSLFKRLLLMVRNLRAESDRMHALACICRTAICVDLFAKESVRRGQKPLPGTDITSLFEDVRIYDDLNSISSKSLFREELVASLVESCFQLSLPLPEQKNSGTESRVIGALAYGTGYGALNWTESALEVVEVCRPCVMWDCDGRTYAIDCYLKLLVRLCHIYDTRGGVKTIKDGASQDQILNETRLRNLQLQLLKDLREVHTPRICARLIWSIAEHFDLEGLDPLLADDPEDPLNILISNMHKVLFSSDASAITSNRLQDVQAVLLCAQRLGSRNARAGQLLSKELEDFKNNALADSVNKHQCRYILQIIKYVTSHPERRWSGVGETCGDYPFSHHKLTVQFYEASAAQDRKLEGLVHKAIQELWRPEPSELSLLLTKGIESTYLKVPPKAYTLTGSSDPCYVEAYHLADSIDGRITLHLKILNLTELELNRVDIRVGLTGALYFMDNSQGVRQLRNLVSQDPVLSSVTVGVSHFERCALWVQVLYYPFYGSGNVDYEGDYADEEAQIMRQKRTLKPELGEPVILRCQPYKVPLTDLLSPHKCSPVEYFRFWPSLPAILEYTGTYIYEGSGFKATAAQQSGASPFLSGLKSLSSKPFHQVCSHLIRTVAGFQLCFAAKTWFGGFLGMMIFGGSEVSRNVDLGDETTTMMCKFVIRSSDASIIKEIGSDIQGWLDDITDGGVEYIPEEEVKIAAAERLRTSMERIALLKAARPPPQLPKPEEEEEEEKNEDDEKKKKEEELDENGKPKGPSTLSTLTAEEAEHRALQAAVIQEWHMLCKEKPIAAN